MKGKRKLTYSFTEILNCILNLQVGLRVLISVWVAADSAQDWQMQPIPLITTCKCASPMHRLPTPVLWVQQTLHCALLDQ